MDAQVALQPRTGICCASSLALDSTALEHAAADAGMLLVAPFVFDVGCFTNLAPVAGPGMWLITIKVDIQPEGCETKQELQQMVG